MRFPPSFLDDIRARLSLSSVLGRHVQWDRRKSNPGRGDFWACCPFHTEKTPSFHADDRKGRYHCFGCNASGDLFTFLVEKEGLSFPEAVERLAAEAGLPLPRTTPEDEAREERRANLYDVMELAASFYEQALNGSEGSVARGYLASRGVSPEIQSHFRLGFAPDGKYALKMHVAEKGIAPEQMMEAGLLIAGQDIPVAYDRFRNRIMFPIHDGRGRVIAFGGRAMSPDAPAKYLNSPDTPLFRKGSVLYNLDRARRSAHETGTVIAVEGYIDVIAMARAGFANAVAPLGTALTEDQLALLWRLSPEPVLAFDGDQAGLKAAWRAVDLALPLLRPGHSLRFALMPEGRDPDDLLREAGPDAVAGVMAGAEPLIEVFWRRAIERNDRSTPERRARLEADLDAAISVIGDQKVRAHYAAELKDRLSALWSRGKGAGGARPPRLGWQGKWPQRLGGGRGRRRPWPGSPPAWAMPAPVSVELKVRAAADDWRHAHEQREALILTALLNHPELLAEEAERLAGAEFSSRELDSLRREILDVVALYPGLDTESLKDHLKQHGKGPALVRLTGQAERLAVWFVLPGAALHDVRIGFRQMLALHRKAVTLDRELKAAERALAEDPSEANLSHLNEIRNEFSSAVGEEASIEGFGEASGRTAGAVS